MNMKTKAVEAVSLHERIVDALHRNPFWVWYARIMVLMISALYAYDVILRAALPGLPALTGAGWVWASVVIVVAMGFPRDDD
jgi:uncharacterized membrane protein